GLRFPAERRRGGVWSGGPCRFWGTVPSGLALDDLLYRGAQVGRAVGDGDPGGPQGGDLLLGAAAAAADDGPGVPHAPAGRGGPPGDERRHRLVHVRLDERRRLLLGGAADLAH